MTQLQAYTLEDLIAKIPGPVFSADSATDDSFWDRGRSWLISWGRGLRIMSLMWEVRWDMRAWAGIGCRTRLFMIGFRG